MRISDILPHKKTLSYEVFPPRGELSVEQATEVIDQMSVNEPDWISVTFSAGGGGNSQNTVAIAGAIQSHEGKASALAHLTCLGSTKENVRSYVEEIKAHGVENVLALRGDYGPGKEIIDFAHASDLIPYLKEQGLCVGGACYPEGHVESPSLAADIEALKAKQDAGVDFLVTQLFFNNEDFYRFRERCDAAGITVPIVVGIMPFTSKAQIQRMAFNCGASIPAAVVKRLVAVGEDAEAERKAGIAYACEQLVDLAANGVTGLHIYSMNKPEIAQATHDCLAECGYLS